MTGGCCLCGAVRYRVSGPLRPVVACHFTQCRKTSWHHVAATSAPRETVEITGTVTWYRSSAAARRGFCPICGSNLFWDGPGRNPSIFTGTFEPPTGITLSGHIFFADDGDYYEFIGDLHRHPGNDPGPTTVVK